MENENKFSIAVPEGYDGTPIVIKFEERTGKAPDQIDAHKLKKVHVEGVILSVEEYILKHYALHLQNKELQNGIVTYSMNPKGMFIKFDENPEHPQEGIIITGKAEVNPELLEWAINSKRTFDAKQIISMIRAQAHNMVSKNEAKDLIGKLQNFEARFGIEVKRLDDRSGNTENAFKQTINITQGEMPKTLNVNIPIFKGGTAVPLTLEIEIDNVNGDVVYSFYSLDYNIMLRDTIKDSITASVDKFRPAFVCIEQG